MAYNSCVILDEAAAVTDTVTIRSALTAENQAQLSAMARELWKS